MAIRRDGDGFLINGFRVSGERPIRIGAGQTPATESPLAKLHESLFRYDEQRRIKAVVQNMLGNEDEATRQQLQDFDRQVAEFINDAKVVQSVDKIRAIMADADLTPDAKQRRANFELKAVNERVQVFFGRTMNALFEKLQSTERLVQDALRPVPRQGQDALIAEMRAAEVRSYLAGLDQAERMKAVLDFGNGAKLEALAALQDDPRGRDFVPFETLNEARVQAIRAQDGEFLIDQLEDDRAMLVNAASRATWIERLVHDGADLMGVQAEQGYSPWHGMAQNAVTASQTVLTV